MRTFYIFKINSEFAILTKEKPYNLYKTMEQIYNLKQNEYAIGIQMFERLASEIDKQKVNTNLYYNHHHNMNYSKVNNIHRIFNYYNDEETELKVFGSHLLLKSTKQIPIFFKSLNVDKNLFACDFQNKDYFWVDQLI